MASPQHLPTSSLPPPARELDILFAHARPGKPKRRAPFCVDDHAQRYGFQSGQRTNSFSLGLVWCRCFRRMYPPPKTQELSEQIPHGVRLSKKGIFPQATNNRKEAVSSLLSVHHDASAELSPINSHRLRLESGVSPCTQ